MGEFDQSKATTTDFSSQVPDFIVESKALDQASDNKEEFFHYFDKATQNFGYYFSIPEIYSAANALATWAFGKGWTTEDKNMKVQLDHVRGMGKDTVTQIYWNHGVVKLVVGDAVCRLKGY